MTMLPLFFLSQIAWKTNQEGVTCIHRIYILLYSYIHIKTINSLLVSSYEYIKKIKFWAGAPNKSQASFPSWKPPSNSIWPHPFSPHFVSALKLINRFNSNFDSVQNSTIQASNKFNFATFFHWIFILLYSGHLEKELIKINSNSEKQDQIKVLKKTGWAIKMLTFVFLNQKYMRSV